MSEAVVRDKVIVQQCSMHANAYITLRLINCFPNHQTSQKNDNDMKGSEFIAEFSIPIETVDRRNQPNQYHTNPGIM